MFNDCIIMAGGSGTRLWPASTSARPKQFLAVPQDTKLSMTDKTNGEIGRSFFSEALFRALALTADSDNGRVIIVAGKKHTENIIEECAVISAKDKKRIVLIPEPSAKNTAPAIACALLYIDWVTAGSERNVLVLTCDHIIQPLETFKTDANAAAALAQADKLAVFGIPPKSPETGYGYIEAAEPLTVRPAASGGNSRRYEPEVFSVASFREKPDAEKARQFIKAKNFYWNSGMFAFSSKFMLSEYEKNAQEVMIPFKKLWAPNDSSYRTKKDVNVLEEWDNMETAYSETKSISFDYAIAEKCRSTVMVKAGFSWTDVGSWDEYAHLSKHTKAEVYGTGTSAESCFVDSDIPVALCGVEDLIVVVRSGAGTGKPAVLVAKKGETQKVKEIVDKIKSSGRTELL